MGAPVDVAVSLFIHASPDRVRAAMFDPIHDPRWMAAVKSVDASSSENAPGARVRRVGRFMGRELRWTTEVVSATPTRLELRIIEGPMRGTVIYEIVASGTGAQVSIRNIGEAPGFAPKPLLAWMMRRALNADLERLREWVESGSRS